MPLPDAEGLRANPNCNRAHIAREMIRAGYVHTVSQAFDRWLGEGKPAYAARDTVSAAGAVRVLAAAGAVPVLAHPVKLGLEPAVLAALISHLKENGLAGMEVYHPSASVKNTRMLDAAARRMGLLVTGGSDFHGDTGDRLGRLPGTWSLIREDTQQLLFRSGETAL